MTTHTKTYNDYLIKQKQIFDFAEMICYSVPNLSDTIVKHEKGLQYFDVFSTPDYFRENKTDVQRLKNSIKYYKKNLSKYLLIGAFGYFEDYFRTIVNELVVFHGNDKFIETIFNTDYKAESRNLYLNKLREFVARIGADKFIEITTTTKMKSVAIPLILNDAFGFDLKNISSKQYAIIPKGDFDNLYNYIRKLRNSVGHQNDMSLKFENEPKIFEEVLECVDCLVEIGKVIDNHLSDNLFIKYHNV